MSFLEIWRAKNQQHAGNQFDPLAPHPADGDNQPGGLSGLLQQFHDKGLGSWSLHGRHGQNLPISADQIQNVLAVNR